MTKKDLTVLLVEDDEGHAVLIEINLREAGVENDIIHVTDGLAALDYVQQAVAANKHHSLMILLDLNLPVLDGYGVLKHLKSDVVTHSIPVIVLTSTDDRREIERCYNLGCNVYLRKPVDYDDFAHAVQQLGLFLSVIELPGNAY
jgi:CheY-like chemotaxis protein